MFEGNYSRVPGYPNLVVKRDGTVWRRTRGRWSVATVHADRHGYLGVSVRVNGSNRKLSVHKAVLLAFVGPRPDGGQCRHLDGNKLNNRLSNLCWGTAVENSADKLRHGTFRHPKLTERDVLEIRRRAGEGSRGIQTLLAREYGISNSHVCRILRGEKWSHVGG